MGKYLHKSLVLTVVVSALFLCLNLIVIAVVDMFNGPGSDIPFALVFIKIVGIVCTIFVCVNALMSLQHATVVSGLLSEVDRTKVPIEGESIFIASIKIEYLNGKPNKIYLVKNSTTHQTEDGVLE